MLRPGDVRSRVDESNEREVTPEGRGRTYFNMTKSVPLDGDAVDMEASVELSQHLVTQTKAAYISKLRVPIGGTPIIQAKETKKMAVAVGGPALATTNPVWNAQSGSPSGLSARPLSMDLEAEYTRPEAADLSGAGSTKVDDVKWVHLPETDVHTVGGLCGLMNTAMLQAATHRARATQRVSYYKDMPLAEQAVKYKGFQPPNRVHTTPAPPQGAVSVQVASRPYLELEVYEPAMKWLMEESQWGMSGLKTSSTFTGSSAVINKLAIRCDPPGSGGNHTKAKLMAMLDGLDGLRLEVTSIKQYDTCHRLTPASYYAPKYDQVSTYAVPRDVRFEYKPDPASNRWGQLYPNGVREMSDYNEAEPHKSRSLWGLLMKNDIYLPHDEWENRFVPPDFGATDEPGLAYGQFPLNYERPTWAASGMTERPLKLIPMVDVETAASEKRERNCYRPPCYLDQQVVHDMPYGGQSGQTTAQFSITTPFKGADWNIPDEIIVSSSTLTATSQRKGYVDGNDYAAAKFTESGGGLWTWTQGWLQDEDKDETAGNSNDTADFLILELDHNQWLTPYGVVDDCDDCPGNVSQADYQTFSDGTGGSNWQAVANGETGGVPLDVATTMGTMEYVNTDFVTDDWYNTVGSIHKQFKMTIRLSCSAYAFPMTPPIAPLTDPSNDITVNSPFGGYAGWQTNYNGTTDRYDEAYLGHVQQAPAGLTGPSAELLRHQRGFGVYPQDDNNEYTARIPRWEPTDADPSDTTNGLVTGSDKWIVTKEIRGPRAPIIELPHHENPASVFNNLRPFGVLVHTPLGIASTQNCFQVGDKVLINNGDTEDVTRMVTAGTEGKLDHNVVKHVESAGEIPQLNGKGCLGPQDTGIAPPPPAFEQQWEWDYPTAADCRAGLFSMLTFEGPLTGYPYLFESTVTANRPRITSTSTGGWRVNASDPIANNVTALNVQIKTANATPTKWMLAVRVLKNCTDWVYSEDTIVDNDTRKGRASENTTPLHEELFRTRESTVSAPSQTAIEGDPGNLVDAESYIKYYELGTTVAAATVTYSSASPNGNSVMYGVEGNMQPLQPLMGPAGQINKCWVVGVAVGAATTITPPNDHLYQFGTGDGDLGIMGKQGRTAYVAPETFIVEAVLPAVGAAYTGDPSTLPINPSAFNVEHFTLRYDFHRNRKLYPLIVPRMNGERTPANWGGRQFAAAVLPAGPPQIVADGTSLKLQVASGFAMSSSLYWNDIARSRFSVGATGDVVQLPGLLLETAPTLVTNVADTLGSTNPKELSHPRDRVLVNGEGGWQNPYQSSKTAALGAHSLSMGLPAYGDRLSDIVEIQIVTLNRGVSGEISTSGEPVPVMMTLSPDHLDGLANDGITYLSYGYNGRPGRVYEMAGMGSGELQVGINAVYRDNSTVRMKIPPGGRLTVLFVAMEQFE